MPKFKKVGVALASVWVIYALALILVSLIVMPNFANAETETEVIELTPSCNSLVVFYLPKDADPKVISEQLGGGTTKIYSGGVNVESVLGNVNVYECNEPLEEIVEDVIIESVPSSTEPVENEMIEDVIEVPPVDSASSDYLKIDYSTIDLEEENFLDLVATIHLEAGSAASLESKCAVGFCVMNRVNDVNKWHYSSVSQCVHATGQFAVTSSSDFNSIKNRVKNNNLDEDLESSILAAQMAMSGDETYAIPSEVQFFYGDPNKRTWGKHTYCFTIGGNSYFK